MDPAWNRLVQAQVAALGSCPVCPDKGTCVFITPGHHPPHCLHEYRLLHAFVARRLRAHPPAGASQFATLTDQAREFLERVQRERPFEPARLSMGLDPLGFLEGRPEQATLARFAVSA